MSSNDHRADEALQARDCGECALVARREFVRDAALAAAALVALGAAPKLAAAAPVSRVSPVGGAREDKAYPIPADDGAQIDKPNDVIIARWHGRVYAFSLACPHQSTTLKWSAKNQEFECPKHHSRFTPDGIYVKDSGRATRGLDRLPIRKDGANVIVNLDRAYQEDENPTEWQAAFVEV